MNATSPYEARNSSPAQSNIIIVGFVVFACIAGFIYCILRKYSSKKHNNSNTESQTAIFRGTASPVIFSDASSLLTLPLYSRNKPDSCNEFEEVPAYSRNDNTINTIH